MKTACPRFVNVCTRFGADSQPNRAESQKMLQYWHKAPPFGRENRGRGRAADQCCGGIGSGPASASSGVVGAAGASPLARSSSSPAARSEAHTSERQSLMRDQDYSLFCKKQK